MMIIKGIILMLIGFSSGIVISGAVFAFIAIIGIVPRLAQKTKTEKYIMLYEEAIIFGGIFGAGDFMIDYNIPVGTAVSLFYMLCVGIFYGCLAVSLAVVLDVIPILS
ncbi:MAG: stage V sporulation protein AB, partial [Firmicutes bacterium]|nr:stage V sporulation protein AB [Bacillota bacterium]